MEDDDFTIDEEGGIDLRYRGWTEIDHTIFSLVQHIEILDLSFNQMQTLPDEIYLLKKMKVFNCTCNFLASIPSTIGKLKRLKELRLNGNKLTTLPNEIGECRRLSKLYLNENRLEKLPEMIDGCESLEYLYLQNNSLLTLPLSLAKLKDTVKVINLENNPKLSIIPSEMHENTAVSMWIICLLEKHADTFAKIRNTTFEMSTMVRTNKDIIEEYQRTISSLEESLRVLNEEKVSHKNFFILRSWYRKCRNRIKLFKSFCKKMQRRDKSVGIYDADIERDNALKNDFY